MLLGLAFFLFGMNVMSSELEKLAGSTNRSRNEVICTLVEWALRNTETKV